MRRLPTGLLVAAVAVLAAAAAVDALRDGSEPTRRTPPEDARAPERTAAVDALRTAGATGTLVYSDAGCRLHALRLPSLRPAPASRIQRCEPHVPTDGIGALLTDSEGVDRIFAVLEDDRVLAAFARWQLEDAGVLRPSPRGTYVALIERENGAVRVFSREADETIGAAAALREAGLRGVLTYSDEDCRLHALTLPDLAGHPAASERRCRLTGVVRLRFGRPVGDPQRVLVARCRSGQVEVSELGVRLLGRAPG